MDSYNTNLQINAKEDRPTGNDDISSMEECDTQQQSHFGGDKSMHVQLRFDLGSFVDSDVLVDTHGTRESHWDFVRQEQSNLQVSEGNTNLLDNLKHGNSGESWCPGSAQSNAQLISEPKEDVNLITEKFNTRTKSMVESIEPESIPVVSLYKNNVGASKSFDSKVKEQEATEVICGNENVAASAASGPNVENQLEAKATSNDPDLSNADSMQMEENTTEETKEKLNDEYPKNDPSSHEMDPVLLVRPLNGKNPENTSSKDVDSSNNYIEKLSQEGSKPETKVDTKVVDPSNEATDIVQEIKEAFSGGPNTTGGICPISECTVKNVNVSSCSSQSTETSTDVNGDAKNAVYKDDQVETGKEAPNDLESSASEQNIERSEQENVITENVNTPSTNVKRKFSNTDSKVKVLPASDAEKESRSGNSEWKSLTVDTIDHTKTDERCAEEHSVTKPFERAIGNVQTQDTAEVADIHDSKANPSENYDKIPTTQNSLSNSVDDVGAPLHGNTSDPNNNILTPSIVDVTEPFSGKKEPSINVAAAVSQERPVSGSPPTLKDHVSGPDEPISAVTSVIRELPLQKVGKKKQNVVIKDNKLQDNVLASPAHTKSDLDPGSAKAARRKRIVKRQNQYSLDGYDTPPKSGSKSSSSSRKRKGVSSSIIADAQGSSKDFLNPASSNVSSSTRHSSIDLNVVETVPHTRPFSEQQQVQLRAQILVYGSLIQGTAPEEALMVAAFSTISTGLQRDGDIDLEGSGRSLWEKQWKKAMERTHGKISLSTPKGPGQVVSLSAKSSESPKSSKNSVASAVAPRSVNTRPTDVSGLKEMPGKSAGMNVVLNTSPSTTVRQITSTVNEPYTNLSSTQQSTCRSYFPMPPPQIPVPPAPQWVSPPTFPGTWVSKSSSTIHNAPSVLIGHVSSLPTSDISVPAASVVPTLNTPVLGNLSLVSNSVVVTDGVQKIKTPTDSRPRKRKKTDSEASPSPTDMISSRQPTIPAVPQLGHIISTSNTNLPVSNILSFSHPTPIVSANNDMAKKFPTDKLSIANPSSLPPNSTPELALTLERSGDLEKLKNQLEEAKVNAEDASSFADSAVRESVAMWDKLRSERSSGSISDKDLHISSSVIAAMTAASVARAAAAAARAAYEAAAQAKTMCENALESSNNDSVNHSPMPEKCNSIITAAKLASKKRLEDASAAITRAKNLDLIVRAAELANTAVSQVGAVMTMGESFPFSLEMLLESGPEGINRVLSLQDTDKVTLQRKTLETTPVVNKSTLDGTPTQKAICWTEKGNENSADHVTPKGGSEDPVNQFAVDSLVEVIPDNKGLRGVWFSARVQKIEGQKLFVVYDYLLSDDGSTSLKEWVDIDGSHDKAPKVRLAHRSMNVSTKKRKREAMGIPKWSVGDRVDAFIRDGWWEGEIKEVIENGENKAKVFFIGDGGTSLIKTSMLRSSLVWRNGQWVLWSKIKKEGKSLLAAGNDGQETPLPKRQKTDKGQERTSNGGLLKPKTVNTSTQGKTLTVFNPDNKPQEGNVSVQNKGNKSNQLGGTKHAKKRKFIEVSKHYNSSKTSKAVPDMKSIGKQTDGALEFHVGSSETNRLDGKSKKNISSNQKVKGQKATESSESTQLKGRNQKEKPSSDAKVPARKHVDNKEPSKKDAELNVKKKAVSSGEQSQSQRSAEILNSEKLNEELSSVMKKTSVPEPADKATQVDVPEEDKKSQNSSVRASSPDGAGQSSQLETNHERLSQHVKATEESSQEHDENERKASLKESEVQSSKGDVTKTKQPSKENEKHSAKDSGKGKDAVKSDVSELRRTSRKIQPTSKLLEGLQTAPKASKSLPHEKGSRSNSKGTILSAKGHPSK